LNARPSTRTTFRYQSCEDYNRPASDNLTLNFADSRGRSRPRLRGEASAAVQLCPRLALRLEVGQASRARWVFTMFSLLNRILVM